MDKCPLHPMIVLFPSINDTLEISSLQRSTTNQATINIRFCEQLRSIACLATTTIKDRCIVGYLLTIFFSNDGTDISMDFLSLVRSSSFTCTNCPDWLVSNDDLTKILSAQVKYAALQFSLYNLILLVCFALFQTFTDTEDHLQIIL